MKTFALAATVVAGLFCTASSAHAQYRNRSGTVYSYPTYSNPMYVTPTYSSPGYNGVVGVGSYTPLGGTNVVVPSDGFSQSYYTPTYNRGTYFAPTYSSGSYYTPTYNNGFYSATPYYNGSNGRYVSPSGNYRNSSRRW